MPDQCKANWFHNAGNGRYLIKLELEPFIGLDLRTIEVLNEIYKRGPITKKNTVDYGFETDDTESDDEST